MQEEDMQGHPKRIPVHDPSANIFSQCGIILFQGIPLIKELRNIYAL